MRAMLMKQIVDFYTSRCGDITKRYQEELEESIRAADLARAKGTKDAEEAAKKKSIKCSKTMALMMIVNQVDDVWNGIPIMIDRIDGEFCFTPIGEDSPNRAAVISAEEDETGDGLELYFVSGHSRNLEKIHFITFSISKESAVSMVKEWMVYGRNPGEVK